MTARFALIISVIFHPVFVNLLSLVALCYLHPVLAVALSAKAKLFYVAFFFTATAIVPLIAVLILKQSGMVNSILLQEAQERRVPYLITSVMMLFTYYMFQKIHAPVSLQLFMLVCSAIVVLLLFVNQYKKLSIHMASLGLLTGVVITFCPFIEVRMLLALVILICGITATARQFAKAHTPVELFGGYIIGFVMTMLLM